MNLGKFNVLSWFDRMLLSWREANGVGLDLRERLKFPDSSRRIVASMGVCPLPWTKPVWLGWLAPPMCLPEWPPGARGIGSLSLSFDLFRFLFVCFLCFGILGICWLILCFNGLTCGFLNVVFLSPFS